jgi:hypothetical protein
MSTSAWKPGVPHGSKWSGDFERQDYIQALAKFDIFDTAKRRCFLWRHRPSYNLILDLTYPQKSASQIIVALYVAQSALNRSRRGRIDS